MKWLIYIVSKGIAMTFIVKFLIWDEYYLYKEYTAVLNVEYI